MDPEQLARWFDAYSQRLMLYARHWLGEDQAEDAVQVAFARLMGQLREPRDVQAWLFRIVRNEAVTRLRRQARHARHNRLLSAEQPSWFERGAEDLIDARRAQEILMTLPRERREVVLLRIWGQLSLKQIGRIVGRPLTTVQSRYKAALAAIKERMQESCETTRE
jgi:RNA polymerase sigma-70 factor (ECF subfamily)